MIENEPATVEEIAGTDHVRITLNEQAAKRLAIQTAPVTQTGKGLTVPAAAVFVDPEGVWWVYTNPEPLVYERQQIVDQAGAGDLKYLSSGPAAGTKVVTVGVQELHGVEDESATEAREERGCRSCAGSSDASLKFRFIVVALTAFLMFFGVQQIGNMAVDVFPEFAPPKVEIHTVAIGLAPTEVEAADHRPAGAVVQRDPRGQDDTFPVGRAAVADRAAVRAGHRPARGAAAGGGADRHGHPDVADAGPPRRSCSSPCPPPAGC